MKVASIVEGDGEVAALPILLRRIGEWKTPAVQTECIRPIRVHRDRFLSRDDEFKRHVLLAADKCGVGGWVLILLDADDDCPMMLGRSILERANAHAPHRSVSVVLTNREYEAWFIAAAASLHERRSFVFDPEDTVPAEAPRDAKGWVRQRMSSGAYGETTDQPAFSALMDLQQAFDRSRSFRKLCSEWQRQTTNDS
jgi:Domain of unknown function (DUF4276)